MNSLSYSKNIRKNSKGSAIITVVVSMLFVMALGAALLFAAFTAYTIRITERNSDQNFYSASAAMDDIRAGLQTQVTNAISVAYTGVLTSYTSASTNPQNDFTSRFLAELAKKQFNSVEGETVTLFLSQVTEGNTVISGYDPEALITFIREKYQLNAKVSGGTAVQNSTDSGAVSSVTLKAVSLKYIDEKGYESNITTDITIAMPDFFAGSSVTTSINNYALVANNGLNHSSGGDVSVEGSVFVGSEGVSLSGGNNTLTMKSGDVICTGPILLGASTGLTFDAPKNELWAAEIRLGASASANLAGIIYVSNDLTLDGSGASVTLRNSYFGFGSNEKEPSKSSAILINGMNSTLDISQLDKLSLAGVSFIDLTNADLTDFASASETNPIGMGESLSIKSDQLAYLVPAKCITNFASNPCVFKSTATLTDCTPTVDMTAALWDTDTGTKTLSDYIGSGKGGYKALYKNLGVENMRVAYVFLVFNDKAYANTYFKDYFAAQPENIELYLKMYFANLSDKSDNALISTAGNAFYMDDNGTSASTADDKLTLIPASDRVYAEGYQTRFSKMRSPYYDYVNTAALGRIGTATTLRFTNSSGTVAVVSSGSYDYSTDSDTVCLIIAQNNITISKDFKGVVIAGADIILEKSVTAKLLDANILNAQCTVGDTTYTLSDFVGSGAQLGNPATAKKDAWDLDALVSYENWTKS